MPCWYFDKKELRNTPSLQDNIDYDTEMRYRREGARFIIDTGSKMDLGYNTTATGVVYFHRFYMYHSFKSFPRYVTASCCLFLAGKVEETPKKCKDIIKTAKSFLTEEKFLTFGEDPKEEVMTLERILLQTIKFDLQVEHPYSFLLKYAKCLKGDRVKLQKMVQMAWTFVNDSLCTTLCLQWEPEIIAVALMYLAGKLSKFEVVDWTGRSSKHLRWWDMFIEDVTMDLLEDICHQVLDLYSQPQGANPTSSPPLSSRAASKIFGDYNTASPKTDILKESKKAKVEKITQGNNNGNESGAAGGKILVNTPPLSGPPPGPPPTIVLPAAGLKSVDPSTTQSSYVPQVDKPPPSFAVEPAPYQQYPAPLYPSPHPPRPPFAPPPTVTSSTLKHSPSQFFPPPINPRPPYYPPS